MSASTTARTNPYVGPRAFQPGETLYGRDRELADLLGLLVAERIVLLHSPSGAGKTSLIQAALIPALVARDFAVLPVVRVSLEPPRPAGDGRAVNRYTLSALLSLEEGLPAAQQLPLAELAGLSLDAYLARRPPAPGDGTVLIFDQFEEILTADPTDQEVKSAFFAQLGAALRDRSRWALFAMREDYVASLAPFVPLVPTRLSTTFRLDLLCAADARKAVGAPAASRGVSFDPCAANRLIDDLRRVYVQRPDGTVESQLGPALEPVQLQVVCYRLWERLPAGAGQVGLGDVEAVGDVNSALADYYDEQVAAIAASSGAGERAIRAWCGGQLITPQGIRGQVLRTAGPGQGLPDATVQGLIDAYLVRAEKRRGAAWVELAHDRLIEPVRASNAAWFAAHLSPLQRQAELWELQSRPAGLLLRDEALDEAERWAAAHPGALTPAEGDLLALSREARAQAARERRNNRLIRILAVVATAIMLLAIFFFFQADAQKARALREQRVGRARELAAASVGNLGVDPQLSVILATQAISATAQDGTVEPAAQEALQQALQASRVVRIFSGHEKGVQGAAYSPDGARLASASNDGTLRVWEVGSGAQLWLADAGAALNRVAWSPDGALLAAGDEDGVVHLWDAAGQEVQALAAHDGSANAVVWSPDGTRLASAGDDGRLKVWETGSWRKPLAVGTHDEPINAVAWSPDGQWLATASDDQMVRLWDVVGVRLLRGLVGHSAQVEAVAWSPDGASIATASDDETVRTWDAETGEPLLVLRGHSSSVYALAFSPDGRILATAGADGTARLWRPDDGRELLTLAGHTGSVSDVTFSPDGAQLATAGNSPDNSVRVWSLAFIHLDRPTFVAYDPSGTRLASASLDGAHLWDAATGRELRWIKDIPDGAAATAFSPGGRLLATAGADGIARLWDAATGELVRSFEGHTAGIGRVAFSPNGALLATASDDGTARLWDVASGAWRELRHTAGDGNYVYNLAFSPDGTRLATASYETAPTLKLWDVASGAELRTIDGTGELWSVAWSPDGAWIAAGGEDGLAHIWDATSGDELMTMRHQLAVKFVAFSPDGTWLATAGDDKMVKVWDAQDGRELFALPHPAGVSSVAFSPDGARLATASADNAVHIFPLRQDNLLALAPQRTVRVLTAEECRRYDLAEPCAPSSP
jgi:WD40 repeat protein